MPLPLGAGFPPASINPLIVRVLGEMITPVPATDGLVHLSYAAQVTNLAAVAAEAGAVDPLQGSQPTGRNRVLDVDGKDITGMVRLFGLKPDGARDSRTVPPGGSGVMFFDVTYPSLDKVPELIAHRVSVHMQDDTSSPR